MAELKQEFMARVAEATQSFSCAVSATPDGFDLRTDIGDGFWLDNLRAKGVAQAHIHHVVVTGDTYKISSDSRDLAWGPGVPVLATPKDVRKAARPAKGRATSGAEAAAVDPFSLEAGRDAIATVGKSLGLTLKQTGKRLEIALTAAAIIFTVGMSFAVAVWVLFFR